MWKFDTVSAFLPVVVLACVGTSPAHGYEIRRRLSESGFGDFKGGTIYPLLKRMEEANLITFKWDIPDRGAARKVYSLTMSGEKTLQTELEKLERLLILMKEL